MAKNYGIVQHDGSGGEPRNSKDWLTVAMRAVVVILCIDILLIVAYVYATFAG